MINNICVALEQLGLIARKRAVHIQFTNSDLNHKFFL